MSGEVIRNAAIDKAALNGKGQDGAGKERPANPGKARIFVSGNQKNGSFPPV
jgi:hypothetical protein